MPAIAIIAAVGTVSAGAALGGVLGGIMIAGGVMSGLGAITGNKKLSMLGAVVSLGAGLGAAFGLAGAANSAWNAATAGNEALQVTGNSFMANGGAFGAAATPVDGMMNGSVMNGAGSTTGLQTFGAPAPSGLPVNASNALDASSFGMAPPPGLESAASGGQSLIGVQPVGLTSGAAGNYMPVGQMGPQMPSIASISGPSLGNSGFSAAPAADAGTGFFGKATAFMKGNPEVVKAGSGLLAGGLQSYSQQSQLDQQLRAQAAARKAYNDSILNQRTTRQA